MRPFLSPMMLGGKKQDIFRGFSAPFGSASTLKQYSTIDFGIENPNRIILVTLHGAFANTGSAHSITSVTIGGVVATPVVPLFTHNASGSYQYLAMYAAKVPTNNNRDIRVTVSNSAYNPTASVISLIGFAGPTPNDKSTDTAIPIQTGFAGIPARGIYIGVADGSTWAGTPGWTSGLGTKIADFNPGGTTRTCIFTAISPANNAYSLIATPTSTPSRSAALAITFAPL